MPASRAGTDLPRVVADALAAIVRSSDDAIYSKDPKAILTSWNSAAERLYGYTAEEAIGQPVSILIPPERRGEEIDILERILDGERVDHHETQRLTKDGRRVDVSISVSPVHDDQGNIVEAAIISRDVSEQKRLQAEVETLKLREAHTTRKQALELNDEVVQGLAVAKLALETGDHAQGLTALTATLKRAQEIVSRLLQEQHENAALRPGDLVRERPGTPLRDDDPGQSRL